ncbi:unnamed protein product [Mytilus edulis]|uniref:Uncharacterized protein n=1 Tax=Mytilus edulis TaxID=6550 RepID=A0A8S3V7B3_MYTED|nr:unnamed protein product [Mytilus edulis]
MERYKMSLNLSKNQEMRSKEFDKQESLIRKISKKHEKKLTSNNQQCYVFEIKIDIDSSVISTLDLSNQFGIISLVERKSEFEFKDAKLGLAQKQLCVPVGSSNRVVDLKIKQKIRNRRIGERSFVCACLLLPDGQELWVYQNDHIQCPRGIAAVNNMDVLVLGIYSNNLSVIKENGQKSNILLRETDGLIKPRALCYNKDRKELLICNRDDGSAAVYKVILG